MLTWEYSLLDLDDLWPEAVRSRLNEAGAGGWELVNITYEVTHWEAKGMAFLKRPMPMSLPSP